MRPAGGLAVDEVSVARDGAPVVHQVSLRAEPGQVTLLLGPNGAGKTTVLEAISGVLPTSGGRVLLGGRDVCGLSRVARARRGLLHVEQGRTVFGSLSVAANLRVSDPDPRRVQAALDCFPELRPRLRVLAAALSGGEQQMLVLARALAADPRVLLVDEMSLGLAPRVVRRLLPTMRAIADRGVTVLLVEQYAHVALAHADRAYVLADGRLSYGGSARSLRAAPTLLRRAYLGERARPRAGASRVDASGGPERAAPAADRAPPDGSPEERGDR